MLNKWNPCASSNLEEEEEEGGEEEGRHGRTATRTVIKALGRWVGRRGVAATRTDGIIGSELRTWLVRESIASELRPG